VEDRILGLEDKMNTSEKMEEYLEKRLRSCERNIQEHCDFIKRLNLQNYGHQRRRIARQRHRKCMQKTNSRKSPKSQERDAHADSRSL
jgi:hypothetical protein